MFDVLIITSGAPQIIESIGVISKVFEGALYSWI